MREARGCINGAFFDGIVASGPAAWRRHPDSVDHGGIGGFGQVG